MLTSVGGHIDQDDDLPGELGQGHVPGPVQQLEAVVVEAALAAAHSVERRLVAARRPGSTVSSPARSSILTLTGRRAEEIKQSKSA